jgi:hypothetical protein
MANEFIIKNGFFSQGSSNITGSLSVSQGITGSLFGTASFATTASYISPTFISASAAASGFGVAAVSASYAATASYYNGSVITASYSVTASYYQESDPIFVAVSASFATTASLNSFTSSYISASSSFSTRITNNETSITSLNAVTNSFATLTSNTFTGTQTINGNVIIYGTASIDYLNVIYETASVIYSSGSNQFGDSTADTQLLFGTVIVTGSLQLTGSLDVTQGITGSLFGTASYALEALTSSYATTASYALNGGVTQIVAGNYISINPSDGYGIVTVTGVPYSGITGSLLITASIIDNVITFTKGDATTFNITIESSSYATQAVTASYVVSSSYATQAATASYVVSSSYAINTSYLNGSDNSVFITTGSNGTTQTINGSLTISQNLTVLGSSSIQYITSSQLIIANNIISVNTINPGVRFGGLAVIDSGSSPQTSGSLLFDSQNNQWIFVHQSDSTSAVTSSVLIMGPQTFNDVGNETTITTNRLTKGTGGDLGEHIGDSNITDTGTVVSINSNTYVTGSLDVTQGITGSLFGTASWALNSVTASYAITALSSSYAATASYVPFNYGLAYAMITLNYLT